MCTIYYPFGGGTHLPWAGWSSLCWTGTSCAALYSSNSLMAVSNISAAMCFLPPCLSSFLFFHIHHEIIRIISSKFESLLGFIPLYHLHPSIIWFRLQWVHTSIAFVHWHRTCKTVFGPKPHPTQVGSSMTFLSNKFILVGMIFWHTLQPKILTLFGIFAFHSFCQIFSYPSTLTVTSRGRNLGGETIRNVVRLAVHLSNH